MSDVLVGVALVVPTLILAYAAGRAVGRVRVEVYRQQLQAQVDAFRQLEQLHLDTARRLDFVEGLYEEQVEEYADTHKNLIEAGRQLASCVCRADRAHAVMHADVFTPADWEDFAHEGDDDE
jgi:hypothetical protein